MELFDPNMAPTTLDQSQVANSIAPEECRDNGGKYGQVVFSRYTYIDGDIIIRHAMMP